MVTVLISLGISATALLAAIISYYYAYRRFNSIDNRISEVESSISRVKVIEENVFSEISNYEEFEETVSQLAERLFYLIKEKYGLEDVTTYQEMIDAVEEIDTGDEKTKEDILGLFRYFVKLEYSEEELSEEERAVVRQAAFHLIRRAGLDLEDLEKHIKEEDIQPR